MRGKKRTGLVKNQWVDLVMSIFSQVYFLFPWIRTENGNYNAVMYLARAFWRNDFSGMLRADFPGIRLLERNDVQGIVILFRLMLWIMLAVWLMSILILVLTILGKQIRWLLPVMNVTAIIPNYFWTVSVSWTEDILPVILLLYPMSLILLNGIWLVAEKMAEAWDEAARNKREEDERKRLYKKERKRRLHFPGRYSRLYDKVLWKDLRFRWRDVCFLFLAGFFSAMFLFVGIGMLEIFLSGEGEEQELIGAGLVEVMREFLIVMILISLFLVTLVLSFYRQKRAESAGLFLTLGIRSDALSAAWIRELVFCFSSSGIAGMAAGALLIQGFRFAAGRLAPEMGALENVTPLSCLWTAAGVFLIELTGFAISHDMEAARNSTDGRAAAARAEKMPGRFRRIWLAAALIAAGWCIGRYAQRRTGESIFFLSLFLLALSVVIRNGWAIWLDRRQKNPEVYIRELPEVHMIRYRFRTTVRYVSLLAIVHICALFFFGMKLVSGQIAADPSELYPYDYVFLADESDEELMEGFQEDCGAQMTVFPIVRATTVDNTEMPDDIRQPIFPQGQNIGISESTYRQLKEARGEAAKDLALDDAGNRIYIVYQQDQGAKAKPVDWYLGLETPYVHIGPPVYPYSMLDREALFPPRRIAGEETGSLIGCFRQGKYENLIVFSDAYFEKISQEEADGPTRLVLADIPQESRKLAEEYAEKFHDAHQEDEAFDSMVKSVYAKEEAIRQRHVERLAQMASGGCLMVMLLAVSLFLLHVKVKTELPQMQKRYQFMECFGMRRRERVRAEQKEVRRFLWIPLGIAAIFVVIFTGIVFRLREFDGADIRDYLICGSGWLLAYLAVQILNLKLLEWDVIRKVEETIRRDHPL